MQKVVVRNAFRLRAEETSETNSEIFKNVILTKNEICKTKKIIGVQKNK
jgi:hypothetical protein